MGVKLFAGSWGSWAERDVPGWEPVVRALNTQPKYVASTPSPVRRGWVRPFQ